MSLILILKAKEGLTKKQITVKHPKTGKMYQQTVYIRAGEKPKSESGEKDGNDKTVEKMKLIISDALDRNVKIVKTSINKDIDELAFHFKWDDHEEGRFPNTKMSKKLQSTLKDRFGDKIHSMTSSYAGNDRAYTIVRIRAGEKPKSKEKSKGEEKYKNAVFYSNYDLDDEQSYSAAMTSFKQQFGKEADSVMSDVLEHIADHRKGNFKVTANELRDIVNKVTKKEEIHG